MAIEIIRQLFQQSDASGAKSTILKPITWFISLLVAGLMCALYFKANNLIIVFFIILISFACAIFFFAFIFCLFKNPDALRSETYSIQKMAIEKGIFGDTNSGTFLIEQEKDMNKIDEHPKKANGQIDASE